jgi:hypothetical protein
VLHWATLAAAFGVFSMSAQADNGAKERRAADELSDIRINCYSLARQIKAAFGPRDAKRREAAHRYEVVRSSCDAWIEKMRIGLKLDAKTDDSAIESARAKFARAVGNFESFSHSALRDGQRGAAEVVTAIVPLLVEIGVKLFEAWQKADSEKRQKVSEQLDELRFASFDTLK